MIDRAFARDYLLPGRMLQPVETKAWTKLTVSTKDSKTGTWRGKDFQAPASAGEERIPARLAARGPARSIVRGNTSGVRLPPHLPQGATHA